MVAQFMRLDNRAGPPYNQKMKTMVIFGTRPEVIKLAPVIREFQRRQDPSQIYMLATAQHRQLLDQMLKTFGLTSDRDLDLMAPDQSLAQLSSRVITGVSEVLAEVKPDLVIVQGDTTTAMASALAAFYRKIRVAHVEAGLRTGDPANPFPEEINRKIISSVADFHFAPTSLAVQNLKNEGIPARKIRQTGNTVVDALQFIKERLDSPGGTRLPVKVKPDSRIILVTSHRRENFGPPLEHICRALIELVGRYKDVEIVYPVHPNPNVKKTAVRLLAKHERIHLIQPLDYLQLLQLMKKSYLVLTDSGGIQEEAPSFRKPVLVMRDTTERPEGIRAGVARLVGTRSETIIAEAVRILESRAVYRKMTSGRNPYGDGRAARRIVDFLLRLT